MCVPCFTLASSVTAYTSVQQYTSCCTTTNVLTSNKVTLGGGPVAAQPRPLLNQLRASRGQANTAHGRPRVPDLGPFHGGALKLQRIARGVHRAGR